MPRRVTHLWQITAWAAVLLAPALALAQGGISDGFESPETSWQIAEHDVRPRMEIHERVKSQPHTGQWCERIRLSGDNGSYFYLKHAVGQCRVISELTASLWVRADRPGLQLLARVVLPRTLDPNSKQPATVLVPGDSYTQVGVWQQLSIRDVPLLTERQARVLRATIGPHVDTREAHVDHLYLNAYGGPGVTNLWLDDLELSGIARGAVTGEVAGGDAKGNYTPLKETIPERIPAPWEAADSASSAGAPEVRLQGNVLIVGGKPFFPRMIHYRGEPLEFLRRLGFNTIHLPTLPTVELLEEAQRNDMWLVARPPVAADLNTRNANGKLARIGNDFDRVLAWDLGSGLTSAELVQIKPWVKLIRSSDARRRPILSQPASDLRTYSRYTDIIMSERKPLGTSQELNEYGMWLRSRGQLTRPGTPLWTTVQTQPTPQLIEQLALLTQGQAPRVNWQYEQIRLLVTTALAAGMRGICFESLTPLDADDPETQHRAAILEWLNLELELLHPWTSGGIYVSTADSTDPRIVGVVLQTERAKLLLPLAIAPYSQYSIDHGQNGAISFTVPGASESNDAFELSPAGLRPLAHHRIAGGLRVTLTDGDRSSPIVLSQDPVVVANLARRTRQLGSRMFELRRRISSDNLSLVAAVDRKLSAISKAGTSNAKLLETARKQLNDSESIAATNDWLLSAERARQGMLTLRQLERAEWTQAVARQSSPLQSPFAVSFQTLPEHWQFQAMVTSAGKGPNRLRGGDCESLDAMVAAGWKHLQHPQPGVTTSVELTEEVAHSGRASLRLRAVSDDPLQKPQIVETPPMWITTAPARVEPGDLIEIRGFVRVLKSITGSVDGLMILDSITGDALAERIRVAADWQEFVLYRAVPESGNLTVTFALTGLGEAWIDDLTIQAVDRGSATPSATRLPAATIVAPMLR